MMTFIQKTKGKNMYYKNLTRAIEVAKEEYLKDIEKYGLKDTPDQFNMDIGVYNEEEYYACEFCEKEGQWDKHTLCQSLEDAQKIFSDPASLDEAVAFGWFSSTPYIIDIIEEDAIEEEDEEELIKACMKTVDKTGYHAGEQVAQWFQKNTNHPHVYYTFQQKAVERNMNRDDSTAFAQDLAETLADLVIRNEQR